MDYTSMMMAMAEEMGIPPLTEDEMYEQIRTGMEEMGMTMPDMDTLRATGAEASRHMRLLQNDKDSDKIRELMAKVHAIEWKTHENPKFRLSIKQTNDMYECAMNEKEAELDAVIAEIDASIQQAEAAANNALKQKIDAYLEKIVQSGDTRATPDQWREWYTQFDRVASKLLPYMGSESLPFPEEPLPSPFPRPDAPVDQNEALMMDYNDPLYLYSMLARQMGITSITKRHAPLFHGREPTTHYFIRSSRWDCEPKVAGVLMEALYKSHGLTKETMDYQVMSGEPVAIR